MERVKLRPHNVDIIYQDKRENIDKEGRTYLMNLLYGEEFNKRFVQFVNEINDDTLVEIVSGNDDICDKLICPYSTYCGSKDYSTTSNMMIERLPPGTEPEIIAVLKIATPEMGDKWSCRKYGLDPGTVYRFGDIRVVEEKPSIDDLLVLPN